MIDSVESCPTPCTNFFSNLFNFFTNCFDHKEALPLDPISGKLESVKQTTNLSAEMLALIVNYAEDLPIDPVERETALEKYDLMEINSTDNKEKLLNLCTLYSTKRLDWEYNHRQSYSNYNKRVKFEQEEIERDFTNCNDVSLLKSHAIRYCQHYYTTVKKQIRQNTKPSIEVALRESPTLTA